MKVRSIGFGDIVAGNIREGNKLRVNSKYTDDPSAIGQIRNVDFVARGFNGVSISLSERHGKNSLHLSHLNLNPNEVIPYYDLVEPKAKILAKKAVKWVKKLLHLK